MRYLVLLLLNTPVIFLAFLNTITRYRMGKTTRSRFWKQLFLWILILCVLVGSFPVYNILNGRHLLDSSELSLFDIVQTTVIVLLFYVVTSQQRKIVHNEDMIHELHREISIDVSTRKNKS